MERFLSCDWGTSVFRLRLVGTGKRGIYSELSSDQGIAETYRQWLAAGLPETERINFYRNILTAAIRKLSGRIDEHMPVVISGMASSSIGLAELPYQKFPFNWDVSQFVVKKMASDEKYAHPLTIVSGFKTDDDIMRGEEMLLLGCDPGDDRDKIFIFPGTHSKHVFVKNKTGVDLRTYMTGEIFNLLAEKSILRNSVKQGTDEKSFAEGFKAGLEENILHQAFQVRTRQLLKHTDEVSNFQFLSGLLIGTELRNLKGSDCPVYLVSGEHLGEAYRLGLKLTGSNREVNFLNADEMLVKGHIKLLNFIYK
jgi:2-dehydro-3-deoxygalactonokinase